MMKKFLLMVCVAVAATMLFAAVAHAADDPITATGTASPKAMSAPQDIEISIVVKNDAQDDYESKLELFDAANKAVSWFGEDGKATVAAGEEVSFTGAHKVTSEQLSAGKISYKLKYQAPPEKEGGNPVSNTRSIPITISKSTTAGKLSVDYSVSPASASKGQTVTFTYTLSNIGDEEITNVQIKNPNITDKLLTITSIPAEATETRTFNYTMGSKAVKAKPSVTYRIGEATKVYTITNLPMKEIAVAKGGVIINLKATGDLEALPGETIDLECTITNNSNTTYEKVVVTDALLGEITLSGTTLKPKGGKLTGKKTVTIGQTADYAFKVTSAGGNNALNLTSNSIHVIALDEAKMLKLEVSTESQAMMIYQEPALMDFIIRVKNVGAIDGKNLVVKLGKTDIATIPALKAGEETVLAKSLELSMHGKYAFTITGLDAQGATQSFQTNELMIDLLQPTPEPPPPTEEPYEEETPEPFVAPTEPPKKSGNVGMTLLYVMAGLIVAALLAVLGMVILGRRKSAQARYDSYGNYGGEDETMDSVERGSRRDYMHRAGSSKSRTRNTSTNVYGDEPASHGGADAYEPATSMHALAARYRSEDEADDAQYAPDADEPAWDAPSDSQYRMSRKQPPLGADAPMAAPEQYEDPYDTPLEEQPRHERRSRRSTGNTGSHKLDF